MGLNFDKHREHLEKDIREALQHVFGENFEIIDIQNIVFNAYCPTFNFEIELKDYKNKIDILIDGRDLKLYWGEERYALGYEYDCDHLNEGLRRIKAYLDQPELIFSEPVSPQNIYLKVKALERMIESTFEGIAKIDYWKRPFEKNESCRFLITCLLPHYPAFFSLEIAGQQFVLEEIDPMASSIESQSFPLQQHIDLTVSNMTSFLDWFKDSLEGKLNKNASTVTLSCLRLPLDPATVEENISQVQEIIRSTFTKDVSFMEANKLVKSNSFYGVDFSVLSEYYDARFSISLVGRHFDLHVMKPDKPEKKDNWMINGFPYLLTEENLSKAIREAEAYFVRQSKPVETTMEFSKDKSEEKLSSQARAEVEKDAESEQANIKENLRLKKLWQLQFLFFFLFMIAILVLAIYTSLKE